MSLSWSTALSVCAIHFNLVGPLFDQVYKYSVTTRVLDAGGQHCSGLACHLGGGGGGILVVAAC